MIRQNSSIRDYIDTPLPSKYNTFTILEGYNALHVACSYGSINVVSLLIDNGANINCLYGGDRISDNALSITVSKYETVANYDEQVGQNKKYLNVAAYLIKKGAKMDYVNISNMCKHGHIMMLKLLLVFKSVRS